MIVDLLILDRLSIKMLAAAEMWHGVSSSYAKDTYVPGTSYDDTRHRTRRNAANKNGAPAERPLSNYLKILYMPFWRAGTSNGRLIQNIVYAAFSSISPKNR